MNTSPLASCRVVPPSIDAPRISFGATSLRLDRLAAGDDRGRAFEHVDDVGVERVDLRHAGRFAAAGVHLVRRGLDERRALGEGRLRAIAGDIGRLGRLRRSRREQRDRRHGKHADHKSPSERKTSAHDVFWDERITPGTGPGADR